MLLSLVAVVNVSLCVITRGCSKASTVTREAAQPWHSVAQDLREIISAGKVDVRNQET
jgi:hypothetical protein